MFEKFKKTFEEYANISEENPETTVGQVMLNDEESSKHLKEVFEADVIRDITSKYAKRKADRMPLDLKWRLNINYYNGDQFTYIDNAIGDILESPLYTEWEERQVYNEIAPNIETRFAILSKRKNNMKNRPASSSSEDRTSAKIGNKILASTKSKLRLSDLSQEANLTAGIMGTAIWKTCWDASKGMVVGLSAREMTIDEESLNPYEEYEKSLLGDSVNFVSRFIREGDVNTTLHSPFEIYPENVSKPLRENKRVMHVVLMSPEEIFEKWGVIEEGKEHETYKILSSEKNLYGGSVSSRAAGKTMGLAVMNNTVMVYEEHEMPSSRYPHGRLIICTDNHLLYYGVQPDTLGENDEFEFCFDVQQSMRTDGFFGKSVIERMIPLQNKYNALKNRKQDYLNRIAIGVLLAEEGSLVDEEDLRNNGICPGDIIAYRKGYNPPQFMTQDDLPTTVENEESNILNAFNRMAGVSQLAQQSVTPSNVTSGVAIAGLSEQDDTRIGLEAENIKGCMMSIGRKWLVLYRNHVDFPRMVREIGKNEEFEIGQFVGSDITSFDVFIESEPESSDTLSQRRQKVVELLNSGLFNDTETGNITQEGRVKIFEMLELGDWENFVTADDAQQRRADRENNGMIAGEVPKIRSFDDDVIHIAKHNNFRLMAEYDEAIATNPEIDELFEAHLNEHIQNLQVKNESDQQQAMPPDGSAGGITDASLPSHVGQGQTAFGGAIVK